MQVAGIQQLRPGAGRHLPGGKRLEGGSPLQPRPATCKVSLVKDYSTGPERRLAATDG